MGVHDICPFPIWEFHDENIFFQGKIIPLTEFERRALVRGLNSFASAGRRVCQKELLLTLFALTPQGLHDKVLEDCDTVLSLNASNCKALYRKSKALSDLGRYREAYDSVAKCSLAVPQVRNLYLSSLVDMVTISLLPCGEGASEEFHFPVSGVHRFIWDYMPTKQVSPRNMSSSCFAICLHSW